MSIDECGTKLFVENKRLMLENKRLLKQLAEVSQDLELEQEDR